MPANIATPPLLRRDFLRVGAAGIATLWLRPEMVLAGGDDTPEFTFALFTDTHLRRQGKDQQSKDMQTMVAEINASAAEFSICCGDLVNNGEAPENEKHYGEWLTIAKGLKKPFRALPGNHDPDALFTKHIQKELDFVVEHGRYRFICFRDAEVNPGHDGVVTPAQLQWLQAQVSAAVKNKQRVMLVAHVIYHANKHPDVGWAIKTGRAEFGEFLKANAAAIDVFFAGHFHCGMRGWSDSFGIHEVILPALSINKDRQLAKNNAPGYAIDEFRNGYTLARVFKDKIVLEYKPLGEAAKASKELSFQTAAKP